VLHRHMGVRVGYLILITVFEVPCAYGGCAGANGAWGGRGRTLPWNDRKAPSIVIY